MTTDRAGPEGTIERGDREETCPHALYWLGPEGTLYVLDWLDNLTSPQIRALMSNTWPDEPAGSTE